MDCPFDCGAYARYSIDLPYPLVTIQKPNRRYAAIISGAFAGKGSETTAIAQYGNHRLFLQNYPEAFEAYQYIAFVETIHWQFLGFLIKGLGVSPKIYSWETNAYWSGRFPAYRLAFREIIESDIAGEKDAIAHYKRMISQIDDRQIQSLFERIILDEEKHVEILTGLYNRYR